MLGNRTASQPSTFVIPVTDEAGVKIDGVSASWELFDERGNSIDAGVVADFDPDATTVSFVIDAVSLSLAEGEQSAGREIVVFLTLADDSVAEVRDYFVVVNPQPLAVMVNSFITYPEAIALRTEFGQMPGWDGQTRTTQSAALAQAFRNLCKMTFKVPGYNGTANQQKKAYWGTGADVPFWASGGNHVKVATLTVAEFDALPEAFRRALKRAQIAEANNLLGGDPIGDKRKLGIISETVGESSAFFSSKPYLNLPITRAAYDEVQRYVYFKVGLSRG